MNMVVSEQGSVLAYAVTERDETGKRKAYAVPGVHSEYPSQESI
jgi:hypothetical protein